MFKNRSFHFFVIAALFFGVSAGYFVKSVTSTEVVKTETVYQTVEVADPFPPLDEDKILEAVNKYRSENDLPAIKEDYYWCGLAAYRSHQLNNTNTWDHSGFEKISRSYRNTHHGENLARDIRTDNGVVDAWKISPTHKEILDDARYSEGCVSVDKQVVVLILSSSY